MLKTYFDVQCYEDPACVGSRALGCSCCAQTAQETLAIYQSTQILQVGWALVLSQQDSDSDSPWLGVPAINLSRDLADWVMFLPWPVSHHPAPDLVIWSGLAQGPRFSSSAAARSLPLKIGQWEQVASFWATKNNQQNICSSNLAHTCNLPFI